MEKRKRNTTTSSTPLHWADCSGLGGSTWTNHDCFQQEEEEEEEEEETRINMMKKKRRETHRSRLLNMKKKRAETHRSRLLNTDDLPDECLANVFEFLNLIDRQNSSLVCHRWSCIEGQSRRRLSLGVKRRPWHYKSYATDRILPDKEILSMLTRFDSLTSLALEYVKFIRDDALVLISLRCRNLTRLKLHGCRALTDAGVVGFAVNCKGLKEFHAEWCEFGAEAINAIVDNSSFLEELSALTLGGLAAGNAAAAAMSSVVGPGLAAASSLKTICIGQHLTHSQIEDREYYSGMQNAQCFAPLIIASKNLRTLKICGSSGEDWDKVFEAMVEQQVTGLVEIQLTTIVGISDAALLSISNFSDLETLHLAETVNFTDAGLAYIASGCKRLRRLHIQNWWKTRKLGDEGIFAIAKGCPKLEELFLMRANITCLSLNMLAENCPNLESLALCWNNRIGDVEMKLIAAKFMALKNLNIYGCGRITDEGVIALSSGCPNLVRVEIIDCEETTWDGLDRLKAAKRNSLVVNYYHYQPRHNHTTHCQPRRNRTTWPLWADPTVLVTN